MCTIYVVKTKAPLFSHLQKSGFLMTRLVSYKIIKNITKTSPCNEDPRIPHFYIVKLGFTGVYIIFLFLLYNIDCGYSLEPPH